jgi:uncharacterized protein YndB with AHSA1/START domain
MPFVAEFAATVDRLWQLWADRDTLERWWGPPGYPATLSEFEFAPGGRVLYRLVGDDDGERLDGHLTFHSIDEPREIVYTDVFVPSEGGKGEPDNRTVVTFESTEHGSRMTLVCTFDSDEAFSAAREFGAFEGYIACLSQIDDLLSPAKGLA